MTYSDPMVYECCIEVGRTIGMIKVVRELGLKIPPGNLQKQLDSTRSYAESLREDYPDAMEIILRELDAVVLPT